DRKRIGNAPQRFAAEGRMASMRRQLLPFASLVLLGLTSNGTRLPQPPQFSILQFDTPPIDDRRLTRVPFSAETVERLARRWDIALPEVADGSPLFLAGARIADLPG